MTASDAVLEKVGSALARHGLRDAGVVAGVSGGPDSVALLLALHRLDIHPLVVAHVNHQLRGKESDGDEEFVRELCEGLGLPLETISGDTRALAQKCGKNLEAVARKMRYGFFRVVAHKHQCIAVATGHTADDQAETVLHRLLRGAGLQGLRGIAARRPLAEKASLVRPMLDVSRSEVLAFLDAEGVAARTDSTNADRRFMRNRLRHELLPLLERNYNPGVRRILLRLADEAREAFAVEQQKVRELLKRAELPRAGALVVFRLPELRAARPRLVRLLFRHLWEREDWPTSDLTRAHWQRLEKVLSGKSKAVEFPGLLRVACRGDVVLAGPTASF